MYRAEKMKKRSMTERIVTQWPEIAYVNLMVLAWLYTDQFRFIAEAKCSLFGIFSVLCGITGFILGVLYFLDVLRFMPEKRRCKWLAGILMFGCMFEIFMSAM